MILFGMAMTKIKMIVIGAIVAMALGVFVYVQYLQSEVETLKDNNAKLEYAYDEQQKVIAQKIRDIEDIRASIKRVDDEKKALSKELDNTEKKFNKISNDGKVRDIGELAIAKPELLEKLINKGTKNALRCFEIATGSPLTERELSAVKESEINQECPHIIKSRQYEQ